MLTSGLINSCSVSLGVTKVYVSSLVSNDVVHLHERRNQRMKTAMDAGGIRVPCFAQEEQKEVISHSVLMTYFIRTSFDEHSTSKFVL